jgi:hypothetical protein
MSRGEELDEASEQSRRPLPKKPYSPSPYAGSLRTMVLETCSPSTAQQQKRWSLDVLVFFVAVRVATTVAVARIYREDPPRVTASRNRLYLSLSKRIRRGLVANGKSRSRAWEALDRILAYYSRPHRAPAPIVSPRLARPDEARWASARVFPPFLLSFTHLQVHREQLTL